MDSSVWLWLLSAALIVAGVAGTILPALPGTALVLAGIVVGAWIDDFTRVGPLTLALVGVMAVLAWVLDYVAGLMGAKRVGASTDAFGLLVLGSPDKTRFHITMGTAFLTRMTELASAALSRLAARPA